MFFKGFLTKNIFKNLNFSVYQIISGRTLATSNTETVDLAYTTHDSTGKTSIKPPLVIFHGLCGSKNNWDAMGKAIHQTTGRSVICIDARNHGDSGYSSKNTYLHMAHDVIELLRKLDIAKVSVLGHSMGGYTAIVLSLIRPTLVSSLIVEDASPVKTSSRAFGMLKLMEIMAKISIKPNTSISEAREFAHEQFKKVNADINMRNYLIESLVRSQDGTFAWKINLPTLMNHLITHILHFPASMKSLQYVGPTLFIGGTQSDFIGQSDLPEIRKYFPCAELTYVEGAGHFMHTQKPEKFREILCKFLIEK